MDKEFEKIIEENKPNMEAIIYLKDGIVDRVEAPDGAEIAEDDRSPQVQAVVDMYRDWPHKVTARLFLYKDGGMGCSIDD